MVPKWNLGFLKTKAFLISVPLRSSIVKVVCSFLQEGTTRDIDVASFIQTLVQSEEKAMCIFTYKKISDKEMNQITGY